MTKNLYLSNAQLKAELSRCLNCKTKPCMTACPVNCRPWEFIQHALSGDFDAAVKSICRYNPMGQTCGLICPETFCMKACLRANLDSPIRIPKVQATILEKYRTKENHCEEAYPPLNGKNIAIVGAGPAGIAATSVLAKLGYKITIFEGFDRIGGALNLIPETRLPHEVITKDWSFVSDDERISLKLNTLIEKPENLLKENFDGIIVAVGETNFVKLNIEGEEYAIPYHQYLRHPQNYATENNVAVIGGGSVASDCAVTAKQNGAENVEMFVRRRISDMRITANERKELLEYAIDITTMTRVNKIIREKDGFYTLYTTKTRFNNGKLEDIPETTIPRPGFSYIIKALGSTVIPKTDSGRIIYAGDCKTGGSTIVESLASGQKAAELLHFSLENGGHLPEELAPRPQADAV